MSIGVHFTGRAYIERENIEKAMQEKIQDAIQESEVCTHAIVCMHVYCH